MTEKEKMLNQKMYDANYDKELIEERKKAKELCFQFNNTHPSDDEKQKDAALTRTGSPVFSRLNPGALPRADADTVPGKASPERRSTAGRAPKATPGRTAAERTIPYPKEGRLCLLNLGGTTEFQALVPNRWDESIFL